MFLFAFFFMSTGTVISLQQSPVPLQFPLPDVVIATDATATHWAFHFQWSGLPSLVSGSWSGSMCRTHIALQEVQAIAMMLYRMAFHLSGKVFAFLLDNNTVRLICVINVVQCLCFFSGMPAGYWVWLTSMVLTLIPAYIPTHISVEANYLSWDQMLPEWDLNSGGSGSFWPLGSSSSGPAGILLYHPVPALLLLGISTTSEGLEVECLQPSLDISGKLHVSSSCISSSISVQVSGRTCHRST